MAYEPINWQTGDIITTERLNRMDRGWGYENVELFSETVTTAGQDGVYEADLAYAQLIDADPITVTYDGMEYVCPRISGTLGRTYGAHWSDELGGYDFSEYPFGLVSVSSNPVIFATQTAGEHTVAVSASTLQTSADFSAAVSPIVDAAINAVSQSLPLRCVSGQTEFSVMRDAQTDGRLMYFQHSRKTYFVHNVTQSVTSGMKAEFFPENNGITVYFDGNSAFTVTSSTSS